MKKELKICLPLYKIIYSLVFVVILSIIRGIVYVNEIGIAMEPAIALLAMVFCADTYTIEIDSKRNEILKLSSMKKLSASIRRRVLIQMVCLLVISMIGYGLFYWQKPISNLDTMAQFGMFVIAMIGTISFWGVLSETVATLFHHTWGGIGISFLLWIGLYSKAGEKIFGKWSIFSFTFRELERELEGSGDWSWMCGKTVSIVAALLMVFIIPVLLKKRG